MSLSRETSGRAFRWASGFCRKIVHTRWIWRYRDKDEPEVDVDDLGGQWRGTTVAGDLVRTGDRGLGIANAGKVDDWELHRVEVVA
jgi:hypothetical protein